MNFTSRISFFLFGLFFLSTPIWATQYIAKSTGDWHTGNIWEDSKGNPLIGVPTSADTVVIDGYTVTITQNAAAKRVEVHNQSSSFLLGTSQLSLNGNITVTVTDDLVVTAHNIGRSVELELDGFSTLTVNGDVSFTRTLINVALTRLLLDMKGDSRFNIMGDFNFDYLGASGEINKEVLLDENAILDVAGVSSFFIERGVSFEVNLKSNSKAYFRDSLLIEKAGGISTSLTIEDEAYLQVNDYFELKHTGGILGELYFDINGGSAVIDGEFHLESTSSDKEVLTTINGEGHSLEVKEDIKFTTTGSGDAVIDIKDKSKLFLGGDFKRPTNYGVLKMEPNTLLEYNSDTNQQSVAKNKMTGAGTDSLQIVNVSFNNSSGFPLKLTGDLVVTDTMELKSGIIETAEDSLIIIEDNATIIGGSSAAYVDGPIVKRGRTTSSSLLLPLGHQGKYAPMTLAKRTNTASGSEYKARFLSCPPPFGNTRLSTGLQSVSNNQFWTLDTKEGSDSINVTLHWMDEVAEGIDDPSTLVVAVGDETTNPSNPEWYSIGSGGFTDNGDGSGSVTNFISCPPPFGNTKLNIGFTEYTALPVELINFSLVQEDKNIRLNWETASEVNAEEFIVERSIDGVEFEEIGLVNATGNSLETQYYNYLDLTVEAGVNYYRIKQIDLDGMYIYYDVKSIEVEIFMKLTAFPNPAKDYIELMGELPSHQVSTLQVFDQSGRMTYNGQHQFTAGCMRLDTDNLNMKLPGIYYIKIIDGGGKQMIKVIKSR